MERSCRAGKVTDGIIIWRRKYAVYMPDNEAKNTKHTHTHTHTHTEYLKTHLAFPWQHVFILRCTYKYVTCFFSVYIFFFCLSASVFVIQCISPHQQAGHTCAPQFEKNSTMATTGGDANTVNQMRPEFCILLNSVCAYKENTVVACVRGVANFVVCGEGTKL